MTDIVEFLRARLSDDEQRAQLASPGPWHTNAECDEVIAADDVEVCTAFALSNNQLRNTATHIARWDPARVLAEVESKRRIVDELEEADRFEVVTRCEFADPLPKEGGPPLLGQRLARSLALSYADHPDFDESWRL